jgi:hypothetical protein
VVLVFEGVGLGTVVKVYMSVILGVDGLGDGLRTKFIKTPKNNNIARLNKANRMIMRGERLGERVAI